jgi:hypothetical protein
VLVNFDMVFVFLLKTGMVPRLPLEFRLEESRVLFWSLPRLTPPPPVIILKRLGAFATALCYSEYLSVPGTVSSRSIDINLIFLLVFEVDPSFSRTLCTNFLYDCTGLIISFIISYLCYRTGCCC